MPELLEQLSLLERFYLEITELKRKEMEMGTTAHLRDLNPEKLTEKDMEIYQKFKNGLLELAEFNEYRHIYCNVEENYDSCEFAAFLANKADYWSNKMKLAR